MKNKILAINLNLSSTEIAIYNNEKRLWDNSIENSLKESPLFEALMNVVNREEQVHVFA